MYASYPNRYAQLKNMNKLQIIVVVGLSFCFQQFAIAQANLNQQF